MVFGDILTATCHDWYIHIDSLIPLKRSLLVEFAGDIGEKFYKNKKNIWVIVSSSCKKALVVNTKDNPEFAKGLVLNLVLSLSKPKGLLGLPFEEDKAHQKEVLNLINEYITFQSLPDIYLTPAIVRTLTMAHLSEEAFLKNNPYYVAITQRLKEDGIIDEDFRLRVTFFDFISKLRKFFRELTTVKEEAYFRICPACLTPFVLTPKTYPQFFCRSCKRERKAINKRIERLLKKKPHLERVKSKKPSLDMLRTYSEEERTLIAWYRLKELAEKKVRLQEINAHVDQLKDYHILAEPLIKEKKISRSPHP